MFPGGLKEIKYEDLLERRPEEVSLTSLMSLGNVFSFSSVPQIIRKAVSGMLPKNKFRDRRLERLLVFPDEDHPYASK